METGNFNVMERLGLQFPVSEFEPQIPDSTTFVGNWEFQRHGISRELGLQFRNSGISIPSPPLHCRLTVPARGSGVRVYDRMSLPRTRTERRTLYPRVDTMFKTAHEVHANG